MAACKNGHLYVVKFLVTHGADMNAKDNDGNDALMLSKSPEIRKVLMNAMTGD